jgi:hypothetical protein
VSSVDNANTNTEEAPAPTTEGELGGIELCAVDASTRVRGNLENGGFFEATIDSGAAACVMPRDLFPNIPLRPSVGSESGASFRTASGEVVRDEGQKTVEVKTEYGDTRRMTCTVTGVRKILLAVSRLVECGHVVHFSPKAGYIQNIKTKTVIPIHQRNGVYVVRLQARGAPEGTVKELAPVEARLQGGRRQA